MIEIWLVLNTILLLDSLKVTRVQFLPTVIVSLLDAVRVLPVRSLPTVRLRLFKESVPLKILRSLVASTADARVPPLFKVRL